MAETLRQKAIRLAQEGKMEKARSFFKTILDQEPDDASAWLNYGTTFLHERMYAKALPYFQKAIELDPEFTEPYLSAGMCLTGLGYHEDAIRLYKQGLEWSSENPDLWYNIAHALMEVGRVPEAIATFDYVLMLKPNDYGAVVNRRDMLRRCSLKGRCTRYTIEDGQLVPTMGEVYSWNGIQFVTAVMDIVDDSDLEVYDPNEIGMYERPGNDEVTYE